MAFPTRACAGCARPAALRGLVRETELRADRLVLPLFVSETASAREPIESMPGVGRLSAGRAVDEAREAAELGLAAVLLFGVPAEKDAEGSGAWDEQGAVQLAAARDQSGRAGPAGDHRCVPVRVHRPRSLRRGDGATGLVDNDATLGATRPYRRQSRSGRRRHRRPLGHDGRARRSDPRGARLGGLSARLRSWPTRPSSPPPSMGPSARRPARRPRLAIAAPTRWTRPTAARRCARLCSTRPRAPTW